VPTTLRWVPPETLTPERRAELLGPGAPFELVDEQVLGVSQHVFAQRLPHLRAFLESGVARFGERPYLVHDDRTFPFAEVGRLVATTAAALHAEHGIDRGDRVAIAAANSADHVIVVWALIALGAQVIELNGWWTGAELEYGISVTEPVLLIGDRLRLDRLEGRVPRLQRRDLDEAVVTWFAGDAAMPTTEIDEDDPFLILFTSGTTGRPKGAVISHRANIHWAQSIALRSAALNIEPAHRCEIAAMPLFHIGGLNAQAIASAGTGTTLVYMPPPGRWTPEAQLTLTEQYGVTTWRLVPTQAWRLLEHPDVDTFNCSTLRSIVGGGSVWSPELLGHLADQWPRARPGLLVGLGMTETCGTGATAVMPGLLDVPGNLGGPPPAAEIRVCEPGGVAQVDDGEIGEIQIRSASVFVGYHGDPDATEAALTVDRWYRSGDFGHIRHGLLFIEGRRSDMILRGGENIYPAEIENRLHEHPSITDVAVVGVAHRTLGEEVKAFVVLREGVDLDVDAVRSWAAEALAAFKVPSHVEFRDHLPHNATGKVMKHLLDAEDVPLIEE
jgi:acyl-CoA synthetase (AMP-forming)/AMP-acid ligase II